MTEALSTVQSSETFWFDTFMEFRKTGVITSTMLKLLTEKRKKHNLSLAKIGILLNITPQTYCNWTKGYIRHCNYQHRERIIEFLCGHLDCFMNDRDMKDGAYEIKQENSMERQMHRIQQFSRQMHRILKLVHYSLENPRSCEQLLAKFGNCCKASLNIVNNNAMDYRKITMADLDSSPEIMIPFQEIMPVEIQFEEQFIGNIIHQ